MCLIKQEFMQYVMEVNRDNPDIIVVNLHGGNTIFGIYIPPSDSIYYNDTCFTTIPNIFHNNDGSRVVIGGGDMNSRVGEISQNLPLLEAKYRPNVDQVVNSHGKLLKKICNSYKCYVLNNLTIGEKEFEGDYTYIKGNGKSQNDIVLSNAKGLENVATFSIHKIGWNFSDHFPVSITAKLNLYDSSSPMIVSADILSSMKNEGSRRPSKVRSENVDWDGYRTMASREMESIEDEIEHLVLHPSIENLNGAVGNLSEKLYRAAKTCENRVPREVTQNIHVATSAMNNADEKLRMYSAGLCSWNEWDSSRKEAVTEMKTKQCNELIKQ